MSSQGDDPDSPDTKPEPAQAAQAAQRYDETRPYRYQPGQSGNPGGKPKGLPSFSAALRRELAKTDRRNVQHLEKIAAKVVAMAMKGDMDAVRWLADRVDGKVVQSLNVSQEHTVNVVPWLPAVQKAIPSGPATNASTPNDFLEVEGVEEVEVDSVDAGS